ncbi:phage tail protein [Actinoplanes subtropicus]|uniref:phage tail protein n=1 Tax=Actinoplanes subtropicus TaxID=543632 RepID=UPI00068B8E16|nr:hypothetical protein [Actinoplanes subtropicus]
MASSHPPAKAEAAAAGAAARQPADHREAEGKVAQAGHMDAAKPQEFDKAAFISAVETAVAKQAPKNLAEADEFGDSGKADAVKADVQGQVKGGKQAAAGEIAGTTAAAPDTSHVVDKSVVPLKADQPPGVPGRPNPSQAIPDPAPAAATDFSGGPRAIDQQMASAQVTETQLARSNEPQFTAALGEREKAARHSETAPGKVRASEHATLAGAQADAGAIGAQGMAALAADRVAAGQQVAAGKGRAQTADEARQAAVTATLHRVFDATRADVEKILADLDGKVDTEFTAREKVTRDWFTGEHKKKMEEYKDRRYSGAIGLYRWGRDKLLGLPAEADQIFQRAREGYVTRMRDVISAVADLIAGELGRAKQRIAQGRTQLQEAIDALPADQKELGRQAAAEFASRFDDLQQSVDDKGTELVDTLASKYNEALKAVDDEIKAEREKNKGLVAKAIDAVKGVIKTIIELKNLLLGVLRKAAQAIMLILGDPIGFLRNLVSAVGAGLKLFLGNIGKHLIEGLLGWLTGAAAEAGLQLPAKWDAKGVLLMLASLLGLTIEAIRARIMRKLPKPMVTAIGYLERAVPLFTRIAKEGIAGLWEEIKERVGDLRKNLFDNIADFIIPTVIEAGITWILSLLNPASAFVRAVKLIIDIVRFVVERGRQIVEFVNAVLDAVISIAQGGTGGVPALIEKALARSIPVLIGVLASILGLGGIPGRVKKFFEKVAAMVGRALDWVIDKIVALMKKLWNKIKSVFRRDGKDGKGAEGTPAKGPGMDPIKDTVSMSGQAHELELAADGEFTIASVSGRVVDKIRGMVVVLKPDPANADQVKALEHINRYAVRATNAAMEVKAESAKAAKDQDAAALKAARKTAKDNFGWAKQAIAEYGSKYDASDLTAAAKWSKPLEGALRTLKDAAAGQFRSRGLTDNQTYDIVRGYRTEHTKAGPEPDKDSGNEKQAPWYVRFYWHQGTQIDTTFKLLAEVDKERIKSRAKISPRGLPKGTKMPDVYKPGQWWADVTTYNAWTDHIASYAGTYGVEALGLLYQPQSWEEYKSARKADLMAAEKVIDKELGTKGKQNA